MTSGMQWFVQAGRLSNRQTRHGVELQNQFEGLEVDGNAYSED